MGGGFNAEVSATTATVELAPLTPGARVLPPLTGSPVLFSPQDPSAGGFTKLPHGSSSDVASVSPESDPTVVHHNITQDQSNSSSPLMMAYYPAWVADTFPPERINFSLFDWIDFAFAVPNANYSLDWDGSETAHDTLTRLVDVAHQQGTKVKLSVGGWSGSKYVTHVVVAQRRPALTHSRLRLFSPTLASEVGRQTLVGNIANTYNQYHLDGIDIDWEYPGELGDPRNSVDPNDTANFFEFLKLLRTTLPPTARISAAAPTIPFAGADGQSMRSVQAFASVLDWILIMNYDTWGGAFSRFCLVPSSLEAVPSNKLSASSNLGPNAPLDDACKNSTQPAANAVAAINAWTAAGIPPSQLVLGVPSYGYVSRSDATGLRQRDQNAPPPPSPPSPPPYARVVTEEGGDSGPVQFRGLVDQGVLCQDQNWPGGYLGCGGFTREWDACSSTPFLRSEGVGQVIAYDDVQSLGLKSSLVRERKLLGVNMFDLHGDTDQWELVDSIRRGLGL